jgi:hypothetical protein
VFAAAEDIKKRYTLQDWFRVQRCLEDTSAILYVGGAMLVSEEQNAYVTMSKGLSSQVKDAITLP